MKRKAGTVELLEEGRAPSAIDRYVMPAKRTRLDGMRSTDFARPTGCTQCGGAMGYDRRVKADCCMGRLYCTWITETTYRITRADPCGYTSIDQPLNDQTPDNTAALSASGTNKQRARAYTSYNASNHMAEWIKRVDGREQTPIPKDLLSMIREELRRRHIREQDVIPEVTLAMMRFIREYRNYDCRCFFENVYKITNLIARRQQPLISYEFSEQIMQMFYLFKHAFREMPAELKNGRTSIPEYGYLIYMFSLLQGYTPILEMLPLIQGDNVLADYNRMMLWTCRHLGWPVTRLSPTSIHRTGNS
jgi:Poxvirus Late Transcription Factor VLTF3 like